MQVSLYLFDVKLGHKIKTKTTLDVGIALTHHKEQGHCFISSVMVVVQYQHCSFKKTAQKKQVGCLSHRIGDLGEVDRAFKCIHIVK